MYNFNNISGYLKFLLIGLIIFFIIKELWWFIVGIVIIAIFAYYAKLIYETIYKKQKLNNENYTPQMGEVYKVCPYCNTKVKLNAQACPICKHAIN